MIISLWRSDWFERSMQHDPKMHPLDGLGPGRPGSSILLMRWARAAGSSRTRRGRRPVPLAGSRPWSPRPPRPRAGDRRGEPAAAAPSEPTAEPRTAPDRRPVPCPSPAPSAEHIRSGASAHSTRTWSLKAQEWGDPDRSAPPGRPSVRGRGAGRRRPTAGPRRAPARLGPWARRAGRRPPGRRRRAARAGPGRCSARC